jgi:hypothetical protein
VCGRNLITGLTSAASPRVDISSTCKVGQKIGVSLSPSVDMFPFGVTIPATVPQRSEIPEGLMNYPVYRFITMHCSQNHPVYRFITMHCSQNHPVYRFITMHCSQRIIERNACRFFEIMPERKEVNTINDLHILHNNSLLLQSRSSGDMFQPLCQAIFFRQFT